MELIILKTNLVGGLASVERAIGENANLPILRNVLIRTGSGKIEFVSTNLELAVECSVSGKIIQGGEATVPFSILNSVVRNLNSERISLADKGRGFVVSTENYEATIQAQNPKEFPIIPTISNKAGEIRIGAGELKDALGRVSVAAQYSDIRPEISGVYLDYSGGVLTLAATDGFRLSERKIDSKRVQSSIADTTIIIPLRTATELSRMVNGDEELDIVIDPNQVLFRMAEKKIISRLIDGTFPDYRAVIPQSFKNEVVVDREELMNALKLTSSFAGRANDVTVMVGENRKFLEIYSSDSALGENRCRVPAKTRGDKFSLVFNWRYLLDGLKIYDGKEVILGVNVMDKPVAIKSQTEPQQIYVAMPIKS